MLGLQSTARHRYCSCRPVRHYATITKKYSNTLELPKTTFPLRSDHTAVRDTNRHTELYHWQRARFDANNGKEVVEFVLHDGPPYANGNLHTGHALNKILKDIIVRRKILEGFKVNYVPGWDCHGLPIELKALQAHKSQQSAEDALSMSATIGPEKVRAIAQKLASDTISIQSEQFQKMALCADWTSPYKTMNTQYEVAQLNILSRMVAKGLVSRAEKPVYWSPSSRTALAEAELEYVDNHTSHSAYVAFPLSESWQGIQDVSLLIWTTTPWTLPANRAIAVNPALRYSLLTSTIDSKHYIVATELVERVSSIIPFPITVSDKSVLGSELVGLTFHDVFDTSLSVRPVLSADYVSADSGTGLVHTAPGHGQEDYLLCRNQEHPIMPFSPVDDAGNYTEDVGVRGLIGSNVQNEGSKKVISILQANGRLLAVEKYRHKYPYDWRTKKPIIVRSTPQFFANLSSIKSDALVAIEKVRMLPETGKNRLRSYVHGRDEWCISRQRSWGVPIPALYNAKGDLLMNEESIAHITSVIKEEGMEAWFASDTNTDSWKRWVPLSARDGEEWIRGKETLDVWFDSGCSWTTLQDDKDAVVADLYLEGSDQHRGWFQSSLLTSIATRGIAPYKQVVTHGFVLDERGHKMSKSLGNVIDPLLIIDGRVAREPIPVGPEVVDKKQRKQLEKLAREEASEVKALGTDTLRLWVAQSDFTSDVSVSNGILTHVSESLRKYRTTLRYILGNLDGYDPALTLPKDSAFHAIDAYALAMSTKFRVDNERHYSNYAFNKVVASLNQYTNAHLSAFYFDTLKDRLYADAIDSPSRLSAQKTLYTILKDYLIVLAPFCPLIVDEVWSHLASSMTQGAQHIYASDWFVDRQQSVDTDSLSAWTGMMQLRDVVNKHLEVARSQKLITSSLQASLRVSIPDSMILPVPENELTNLFIVSHVSLSRGGEEMSVVVEKAKGEKCPRCWTYTSEDPETPCARCKKVLV